MVSGKPAGMVPVFFSWIKKKVPLKKTCFKRYGRSPCASPAPVGGGGAYDAPEMSSEKFFSFFFMQG